MLKWRDTADPGSIVHASRKSRPRFLPAMNCAVITAVLCIVMYGVVCDTAAYEEEASSSSRIDSLEKAAAALAASTDTLDVAPLPGDTVSRVDSLPVSDSALAISEIPADTTVISSGNSAESEPVDTLAGVLPVPETVQQKRVWYRRPAVWLWTSLHDSAGWLRRNSVFLLVMSFLASLGVAGALYTRRKNDSRRFMTTTRLSVMDREVRRACEYIESHYRNPLLGTGIVCEALVTGEAFLKALFERELGMSVDEFIKQVRINAARQLMSRSPVSPDTDFLARETGYADTARFRHDFSQITGTSLL